MTSKAVSRYPKMKLWKIIDLQNFGTGRQIRFGHLTGTEQWHIVLAQAQKRVFKDAYCHISCLTAIDLEGNILWQRGEPSESFSAANLTADVPLQVYDIDGDGIDEVITFKNFEILILDGQTGEVKKKAKSPIYEDVDNRIGIPFDQYAFDRLNLDGIRIANFSGKDRPSDLLIKDRYSRVYALNSDLEVMWMFTKKDSNTGHFPYTFDIDGDGHDEILCGYNLVDHDGTLLWSLWMATIPMRSSPAASIPWTDHVKGSWPSGWFRGPRALCWWTGTGRFWSTTTSAMPRESARGTFCPIGRECRCVPPTTGGTRGLSTCMTTTEPACGSWRTA